jgi:ubiquinone/menaquinone biosynthesis C-methylase UbiE
MGGWNHNLHYHPVVLRAIPAGCRRALDVGCGEGMLAWKLASRCQQVIAIDADRDTLLRAQARGLADSRVKFVEGDVLSYPFPDAGFDLITVVATLHHLPLRPALVRFQELLQPGGVLAIIGLYRPQTIQDYAIAAAAFPVSWMFRCLHQAAAVGAPLQEPKETLREIRAACEGAMPGGAFRRHLLFRYSFVWRKP